MALTNNLKKQVDIPVWEWCRLVPAVSSAVSATCAADNSLYHVSFGRYIYYMQASPVGAGGTGAGGTGLTGFFRYDTVSDSYQMLSQPAIATSLLTAMQFVGGQGYTSRVISADTNTLVAAAISGQVLKGFDIRIISGTGDGQQRVISSVSDPIIADSGTIVSVGAAPQNYFTDSNKNWIINQWVGYQVRFLSAAGQAQVRKVIYNTSTTIYFSDVAKFAEEQQSWTPIIISGGFALIAAGSLYQIESSIITVESNWSVVPDATSKFVVRSGGIWMVSAGATYTIQYYDIAADTWYVRNAGAATSPMTSLPAAGCDASIVSSGENASVWERGIALGTHSTTTLQDTTKSWTTNQWAGYYLRIFSGTGEDQLRTISSNTSNTLTWVTVGTSPDNTSRYFIEAFEAGTVSSVGDMTQTGVSTGSITGSVFTAGTTTGAYYPGQILSGTGVQKTTTLNSQALAAFCPASSATVVLATGNTTGITAGMQVTVTSAATGTLTAGTYVSSVPNSTTIVLNQNVATALTGATLQFATIYVTAPSVTTSNGTKVTTTSTTGLIPGMFITVSGGTGAVAVGTYVVSVDSPTTFTLSQQPATAFSGAIVITCQPYQTVIVNQLSGVVGGAGTYTVFPSQTVSSTSITGTAISTLVDTTKCWERDRWNNYSIRIKSGTGKGQVRNIRGTIPGGVVYTSSAGATSSGKTITVSSTTGLVPGMVLNVTTGTGAFTFGTTVVSVTDSTTFVVSSAPTTALSGGATVVTGAPVNTLITYPAWSTAPDSSSVYAIHGDSDKIFMSFSAPATPAQASTFIHNIDSDMITTGRLLDSGVARGISAQYADHTPVAISSGVPVLPIVGAVGYIAGAGNATINVSSASNIATVTHNGGIFAIGSWVTIAGLTGQTTYNGTWQVINSSQGSVSFYSTTATGNAANATGTVGQSNSLILGGSLTSGAYASFGTATTLTVSGCVPTTYNGTITVLSGPGATLGSNGGYQSSASGSGSGTTITVADTTNLRAGMIPVVTSGTGAFQAGTYVVTVSAGSFTINLSPSVGLSSAVITVVPTIPFTGTVAGNMTTLGVVQKVPQAVTVATRSGVTCTLTTSLTNFGVGSWVTVSGFTPAGYNGVYLTKTGTVAGTVVYDAPADPGASVTMGTVGLATTTELVTTVNPYVFQTGQTVTHRGDTGFSATYTNVAAAITPVMNAAGPGTTSIQYTYPVSNPSGPMVLYAQSTTQLCDSAKSWVPNQWAGCIVTYNSTQISSVAAPVQPTILSAYILANTATTLVLAAAQTTAPSNGISRYVISAPATSLGTNALGSADAGLALGVQVSGTLQDVTKSWATPAVITAITATTITVGQAVATVSSVAGLYPGMIVAITTGAVTLAAGTTISSISGSVVTMSNNFGGTGTTATFTFAAVCNSSGNTITVSGYNTLGLSVGMYLAVTSTTNLSPFVSTSGAFTANGGTNLTNVQVTSIISTTQFTVSSTPVVPLVNATVQASFWFTNQWVNRRVRLTCGGATGTNYLEATVTANTFNSITVAINLPVHGVTGYTILQQPARGVGTALLWNFNQSDSSKRGKFLYQSRGGNLAGFDRLNLTTDKWEFLSPTPNFETMSTGAMYAYDGGNRIYFTTQVTMRVYYLDLNEMKIHAASQYPYIAGTAIVGNRMEIFETEDGLRYLWLNRHSGQECFKQLLFY
jgi:hypothetical protein